MRLEDQSAASAYCVFEYRYRDAANYKIFEALLLRGTLERGDVEAVEAALADDGVFIPEQVGLASLHSGFSDFGAVPDSDDHVWHEFVDLRDASSHDLSRNSCRLEKAQLIAAFRSVKVWEAAQSVIYPALAARD